MIEKFDLLELEKKTMDSQRCALIAGIVDCALVGTISHNNPSVLQKKWMKNFIQLYRNTLITENYQS